MRAPATAPRRAAPGRPGGPRPGLDLARGARVGLYGGSFNPAHEGHAHVAETALRRAGLDRVVWLVAPQNPLKSARGTPDIAERLAGVTRRARGPRMIISDIERRIGTRFTIDTVRWLKLRFPTVRFVWVMGADSLGGFHRWRGWAALAREIPIVVVSRPGVAMRSRFSPLARRFAHARRAPQAAATLALGPAPAWTYLPAPFRHVSSTALRDSGLTADAPRGMGSPV